MVTPLDPDNDPPEAAGFRLLGKLATGGFGKVYLGRRPDGRHATDTLAAVKLLKSEFIEDSQHMQRFHQESKALKRCEGARIPELLALDFRVGERPTLATRFIPGLSLYRIVDTHGPLPRDAVHAVAAELVDTLRTAHDKGLLHRDLHPGNILLTQDGPWIIDFGLTRIRGQRVTLALGTVMGHPEFCAPEQIRGLDRTDHETDVFGVAAILLYALTGHAPYTGEETGHAMLVRRLTGMEPDLSGLPDDTTGRLIRACLSPDPAARPKLHEIADGFGPPGTFRLPRDVVRGLAGYRAELHDFLTAAGNATDLTVPFRPGRRSWSARVGEWPNSLVATEDGAVVTADRSGAVCWLDASTGAPVERRTDLAAPVRLCADGDVLVLCDAEGRLEAWNSRDRRLLWSRQSGTAVGAQVLLRRQSTFLGEATGRLHHFDAVTRRLWWAAGPFTDASGAPALPVAAGARQVYLSAAAGREILCVNDEDGTLGWRSPTALPAPVLAAPLPLEEHLVVADGEGTLRCVSSADGFPVWEVQLDAPVLAPPVRVADTVVVGDAAGMLHCHSAATGEEVWRSPHPGPEEFFALCTDGAAVYAGGWSGRLHLLDATDGTSLQSFDLGGQILATVCAPGGTSIHATSSGGMLHALPSAAPGPR
ncbi:PQQ-binding-like beta-propeller repeat protein [Streptomyces sp. NPDC101225]|uniref:protein kinase domain-containing protein n=1 Tax=Streptomyces sp. NPDC101225 TaxID=3366135 RepID=UPI00381451C1